MSEIEHEVLSEVSGNLWRLEVSVGDRVEVGDTLVILESMKMEIPVEAPVAGEIRRLAAQPDDVIEEDQLLLVIAVEAL